MGFKARKPKLEEAQERHLALIRNMTTESVTPEEADELRGQVSKLIAEVGELRWKLKPCLICGSGMSRYCHSCEADDSMKNPPHIAHRLRELKKQQCDMVTGLTLQLEEKHGPLMQAMDKIAELCGCEHWDYAGQVVRDVKLVVDERNALIKSGLEAVCRQDETNAQLVQLATENNDLKEKLKRVCAENKALQKVQLEYVKGAFTAGAAFNHKHDDSITEELLEKGFAEYWAGVEDLKKRLGG